MPSNNKQPATAVNVTVIGVGALILATLSSYLLAGAVQAIALAACFVVMGASVLVTLLEQRSLSNFASADYERAPETEPRALETLRGATVSRWQDLQALEP